jgi:hypothetical protein
VRGERWGGRRGGKGREGREEGGEGGTGGREGKGIERGRIGRGRV